jgi:hypothetical protein
MDLYKTNTKWLVHSLSTFGARTNHGQLKHIRLTTAQTWGKPSPSPLYYTLQLSMGATSKWLFVPRLPSGSPNIPIIGTPTTLRAYNFLCMPPIAMKSKQSYISCWELSNGMLHIACMPKNLVDSWHLMVGTQIANLTPDLSFGHNLCFRCLNGQCKPILDTYVSIAL